MSIVTGTAMKKLRKAAGITQKNLADLAGVSQAHIAKIEQGRVDPRLSTVNKILRALAVEGERRSKDIMTKRVIFARPDESTLSVSEVMVEHAVSQLPVLDRKRVIGTVTEESIIRNLKSNLAQEKVRSVMSPPLPTVSESVSLEMVRSLLKKSPGLLVTKDGEVVGIITRSDLLKVLS